MTLAPIALFVYNRPWHTRQTLEALSKNELADQSHLIIYADGPKEFASDDDLKKVQEVRSIIREKNWCKTVEIIESNNNRGIEDSEIDGITTIVNKYGRIIVLEDDIVTSPWFLQYMNDGLDLYDSNQNVYSINGYMFPIDFKTDVDAFLCPLAVSAWGWATWKREWSIFETNAPYKHIIQTNPFIRARFNIADFDYASMLDLNTWDINWFYSVFCRNGLGLWPTKTLVTNIGFDGSGVHYNDKASINVKTLTSKLYNNKINLNIKESIDISKYSLLLKYYDEQLNRLKMINGNILNNEKESQIFTKVKAVINKLLFGRGKNNKSIKIVNKNPQKQELEIYYSEEFAKLLDTWGEGTVWNEIQYLLIGRKGRVLDIACGSGKVIKLLENQNELDIFGCDISDFLIKKAFEKGISKEKLNVCDATNTKYKDDFFDFSYSIGSLEHFTEDGITAFIKESYRITNKIAMHNIPISRTGKNTGWINRTQSYYNNSTDWWLLKFKEVYSNVLILDSSWNDDISIGKWFICIKNN